ncbi:MAG: lipid-A-disaccharide synthase [Bacteroidales bacterium]|nr:lipid-A-disaccharide synthase [Bacteroidales bacterium]
MKYYLIAGEASGDLHASHLMAQLKARDSKAKFRYFGGDAMRAVGGTLVHHYKDLAYMGFVQVVKHLPEILRGRSECKQDIRKFAPDVLILVDYPGFNLNIAKWVKAKLPSVKVCYYISPKIWAWKEYRIKTILKNVDCMLSILPFEPEWYRQRGYEVHYVGNPTVDELAPLVAKPFDRDAFCEKHRINRNQSIIALLPGSRMAEIHDNLPKMLQAATTISCHQVIIAGAPALGPEFYEEIIRGHNMVPPVKLVFGETYDIVRAAEVAAVTSGTATLETAYLRCPEVVCYSFGGGKLVYKIMQFLLRKIKYVSLVNLVLDGSSKEHPLKEPVVKELLGYQMTVEAIHHELIRLLGDSAERRQMLSQYDKMAAILGTPGAPARAAEMIISLLKNNNPIQ